MKVCVVLLLVVTCTLAQETMRSILQHWKNLVEPYIGECMHESGVAPAVVDAFFRSGKIPNDDYCWKCNLLCYRVKLGIISPKGDIDVKRWSSVLHKLDLPLAQKCASFVEPDPCEKADLMGKCIVDALSKQYPP